MLKLYMKLLLFLYGKLNERVGFSSYEKEFLYGDSLHSTKTFMVLFCSCVLKEGNGTLKCIFHADLLPVKK